MDERFNEIQQTILDAKAQADSLSALEVLTTQEVSASSATSRSTVSIWRLWVWIFSYALWLHEKVVSANAENSRPHNIPWYLQQCLNFHDGLELVWSDGQFKYDLTGIDDAEDRKIIDRCAVLESEDGKLVLKIATDNAGTIEPVTPEQLVRFQAYMQLIKDAGNQLRIVNDEPDLLKIGLTVYVDPQIIDLATGKLLNTPGEVYPALDAIHSYLANLEFNGRFVSHFLLEAIKAAPGMKLPIITLLQEQHAGYPFVDFQNFKVPSAGYYRLTPENITINYQAYDLAYS